MASSPLTQGHRRVQIAIRQCELRQSRCYVRPSFAPKPILDIKHIRRSPGLYSQNCVDRNYESLKDHSWKIHTLFADQQKIARRTTETRQQINELQNKLKSKLDPAEKKSIITQATALRATIEDAEVQEKALQAEMEAYAWELPNLTSVHTPNGTEPTLIGYINEHLESQRSLSRSHVDIGTELELLDLTAAATTTGWGWYYLINEGALLEQALIQYTLSVARKRGWKVVSPPSVAYEHIANACGFQPRDQNNEQQIYAIEDDRTENDAVSEKNGKPKLVLAGTAEIPLAGMKANQTISSESLPFKTVGVNRCYRAEAGARGASTKGLYRVHEFTKVEMFAWTLPDHPSTSKSGEQEAFDYSDDSGPLPSAVTFDEMLGMQKEILTSLGLHCRILEMPSTDLGASATRKQDIEAYFPSRANLNDGWGEVSSLSNCTDYQSRRLHTRVKMEKEGGRLDFPYTLNGTALAVPRVLAALLEVGWDEATRSVKIPEVLRPWMDSMDRITRSK